MTLQYLWSKFWKKCRGRAIKNSYVHKTSKVEAGSQIVNSTFDRHSFCGYDCTIINCSIGSFCSIANNVTIGGSQHPMEWISTSPVFRAGRDSVKTKYAEHDFIDGKKTIIGNDVWIGEGVLIKQGVTIGHGAVIGMGSIVTKDVAPYTIVAGNPTKLIRKRFDDDIIKDLLELKWWELSDQDLKKFAPYVKEPTEFIKKVKS